MNLCFQARISDESQLSPHPRLQGMNLNEMHDRDGR